MARLFIPFVGAVSRLAGYVIVVYCGLVVFGLETLLTEISQAADPSQIDEKQLRFFEDQIRPILVDHCYECHSAESETAEGGLLLDSRAGWMAGGDSGVPIVPRKPDRSRLLDAVSYQNPDLQMPPDQKLSQAQIVALRTWIEMGAPDPRVAPSPPHADSEKRVFDLETRRNSHWAWQKVSRPDPPSVFQADWVQQELDRFILHRLEANNMRPAPAADRRTFLRRVTFDLIGLPPTPDEIHAFLADESSDAVPNLVERLLSSPHFGEHWAQRWLDLVRYAETRGHEQDFEIPEAYRYRDYVIRALNEDVPYDQFVMEHVAGDMLSPPRLDPHDRSNQSIQGTGFWHLGEATHSPVDIQGDEADRFHNQIDVFSRTFLGLSLGCARCHDHKFDAISQEDYYAMYGYLQSSSYQLADVSDPCRQRLAAQRLTQARQRHTPRLVKAWTNAIRAQFQELPRYLTIATQVLPACRKELEKQKPAAEPQTDSEKQSHAPPADVFPQSLLKQARRHDLSPRLLRDVTWSLFEADQNPRHPFHLLSQLADPGNIDSGQINGSPHVKPEAIEAAAREVSRRLTNISAESQRKLRSLQVVRSEKSGERNYTAKRRAWSTADMIEDFEHVPGTPWLVSGYRFGMGPVKLGEVLLGDSQHRPISRFADSTFAEANALSTKLTGMLRTRTFEITSDAIWYRYRGSGELFLAVDSHRVVAGPLHGVVKQTLTGDPHRWQWHRQYVRDYLGHRVHAEFMPAENFAIDQILFAATAPPDLVIVNKHMQAMLDEVTHVDSLEQLSRRLVQMLDQPLQCLGSEKEIERDDVELLNWMIDQPWLTRAVGPARQELGEAFLDYQTERLRAEQLIPEPVYALALLDGTAEDEPLHIRGSHRNRTSYAIPRRILAALSGNSTDVSTRGSGRLELARRLVDPANPLVPRVMVNRIWYHLMGRGIVPTLDDFGVMGQPPTHPQLLDYLASEFVREGWSLKEVIRSIVLSSTYRMSSRPHPQYRQSDPTNMYFHRANVRRLPAESIRDHILSVSGRLVRQVHGPSVMVHITPFMRSNRSPQGSGPLDGQGRRSIYTEVRRNHLPAMLVAFDRPIPFNAIGRRNQSNSPAQPLILLNDPFVHQQAELWAQRILALPVESDDARLQDVYLRAFARPPTNQERDAGLRFLASQTARYQQLSESDPYLRAWYDLCHTMMNVKEFIHLN